MCYSQIIEYNLLFVVPAVVIAITGPGAYSLDAVFGIALPTLFTFVIGLAIASLLDKRLLLSYTSGEGSSLSTDVEWKQA